VYENEHLEGDTVSQLYTRTYHTFYGCTFDELWDHRTQFGIFYFLFPCICTRDEGVESHHSLWLYVSLYPAGWVMAKVQFRAVKG